MARSFENQRNMEFITEFLPREMPGSGCGAPRRPTTIKHHAAGFSQIRLFVYHPGVALDTRRYLHFLLRRTGKLLHEGTSGGHGRRAAHPLRPDLSGSYQSPQYYYQPVRAERRDDAGRAKSASNGRRRAYPADTYHEGGPSPRPPDQRRKSREGYRVTDSFPVGRPLRRNAVPDRTALERDATGGLRAGYARSNPYRHVAADDLECSADERAGSPRRVQPVLREAIAGLY